ncbi:hypothetical protein PPL_11725 [Heterostelium album PN500]|uniref:Phospholipid/glycerol acyltransferase domain-containing protein n=1 Tax=Heterostelium pallidum (strain ATCC 26659 / Pp 5 / PN500) TaxID=670386 RepID=D3BUA6_HETP5|nr:hypothetical protein PPL_11725 [Heterostelium album PN500]EFA75040.1 hypothetical protein PPL_11725 [Heterostelium album PN500]|eukprot:XP_020427174.1 hypothetical protein PPL_11725 [Heterostelium album PN500]
MVIPQFFAGKSILITGCTGFVGKVLLEKIVRDLPDVVSVYIVIRGNAKERFEDDIVGSRIWDVMRERMGAEQFDRYLRGKVFPISGDLQKDQMGLSADDLKTVCERVNIILHCAASIDFRERLDKAIESNLYGTLHAFEVAKRLKNLIAFVHCSTAYVNSNREGWLDEELPVLDFNPEEMVELIMKQDVANIDKITPNLLGAYPNTYTFTKAITERILALKRGDIPLCFVRPTIIGGSLKEPVPGWVDSVAAVGAVMLYCGVGLVQFMKGDGRMVADIVPVDMVANAMLAVVPSIANQNTLQIYQVGTSHRNPVAWNTAAHYVSEYWRNHTPKKSIARSSFNFHTNIMMYEAHFFMKYGIPSVLLSLMSTLTGNEETKAKSEAFKKMTKAARLITDTFQHFTGHEWVFSVTTLEKIFQEVLDAEDRVRFNCDAAEINWQSYFCYFCYGLHKYVLKEEGVRPPTELLNNSLITKSDMNQSGLLQWIFADVSWAYTSYRHVTQTPLPPRAPVEIRSLVMNSPRVQMAMEKVSREEGVLVSEIERRAAQIMDRMQSNLNIVVVRVIGWFLKKVWRKLYQGIHVDEKGIEQIRAAIQKSPVVLIPTHRSYIDFLIISYIFFEYNLPLPHIAAGEDFLAIIIVRWFFRNAGAFFLRRSFHGDALYWAIFSEYVQRLIIDNQPVEFFIEGKRSRTGKSLYPKMGMLSMIANPFFENKVHDVHVAPIGISYEKVLEGELYSNEMMGESKTKESFNGLLRATKVLNMNWGRINVVFAQPISLKQYTDNLTRDMSSVRTTLPPSPPAAVASSSSPNIAPPTSGNISEGDFENLSSNAGNTRQPGASFDAFNNADDRRMLIQNLGYQIVADLQKSAIVTTTSAVATILLTFRRGISRDELISKVEWLREEIFARGGDVAFEGPSDALVDHSLKLLSNLVTKRRNMYEPAGGQHTINYKKNILVLNFYRNQLLHLFLWDGLVSCVLLSLRNRLSAATAGSSAASKEQNESIDQQSLLQDVRFLSKIMSTEFVNKPGMVTDEFLMTQIDKMVSRGLIARQVNGESIRYSIKNEAIVGFIGNLFCPIIEGYMVAFLTLFSIQPEITIKKNQLLQRMGWFAEKMYEEGSLNYYESCSMELLTNATTLVTEMKVVQKKKHTEVVGKRTTRQNNKKERKPRRSERNQEPEEYIQLLPPYQEKEGQLRTLAERLSSFRKTLPIRHQVSDLRRAIVDDFPILSKL